MIIKILTNSKIILLVCVLIHISEVEVEAQVDYIAHRGASHEAPENTLASANLAWELGADAVELDIQLSKDNKIMDIHDSNTKRTSGQDFVIKDTESAILRKLDVGFSKGEIYRGEKIPFLEEVVETVPPGKKLVVELKSGMDVFPWLKEIVEKCGKQNQLIFICFDWQTIIYTKKLFPTNICYWLCGEKGELMKKISSFSASGLDGINLKYSIIDKEVMDKAKSLCLKVIAYTVDEPKEAIRLIELGVNGITTNRPDWLKTKVIQSFSR